MGQKIKFITTLTVFPPKKIKFKWTHIEQKSLYEIKGKVTCDALLIYPDLNKRFDIHTDASKL